MIPHLCIKYEENPGGGGGGILSEKLGGGMRHASWNPYPISDQNVIFPTLFQTWSKIWYPISALEPGAWHRCYLTYMVGVNIKREMVLSPNEEEVASSKKHTQFKTRVHKPYPISDQNS